VVSDESFTGRLGGIRVAGGAEHREPVWPLHSGAVRCGLSVARELKTEIPNKILGTSAWLGAFLQIGNGGAVLRKAAGFQVKRSGSHPRRPNAKSLAHRPDCSSGSRDDILRVPCMQGGLLDAAGMDVYRRRTLGLWGTMGFGWADNVRGRLVGPAVTRTTSHALVVGWRSLGRGWGRAGGRCAHSRRPLFQPELSAQQFNLRRRCDADRLVGHGSRSFLPSQRLKSEPPVSGPDRPWWSRQVGAPIPTACWPWSCAKA
jgi:hypothetical protein